MSATNLKLWLANVTRVGFFGVTSALLVVLLILPLREHFKNSESTSVPLSDRFEAFRIDETEITIPAEARLTNAPRIVASGTRALFVIDDQANKQSLRLWVRGVGITTISPTSIRTVRSAAISDDGVRAVFIGNTLPLTNSGYLFLWEEGFGVKKIRPESLVGDWKIEFSPGGDTVTLAPTTRDDVFLGKLRGEKYKNGDVLVLDIQSNPSTGARRGGDYSTELTRLSRKHLPEAVSIEDGGVSLLTGEDEATVGGKFLVTRSRLKRNRATNDIDVDGLSDLITFYPHAATPVWRAYSSSGYEGAAPRVANETGQFVTWRLGNPSGVPVPADYDGDGRIDLATFIPGYLQDTNKGRGNWEIYFGASHVFESTSFASARVREIFWGSADAIAAPADYDGDGATDIAVFNPGTGIWQIAYSAGDFQVNRALRQQSDYGSTIDWGQAGDVPVAADYDGDGKAEPAVWRMASDVNGQLAAWQIYNQSNPGENRVVTLGATGDIPVPGDFDGDGRTDPAVYSQNDGVWRIALSSADHRLIEFRWAVADAEPFVGDVDGDGRADPSFFSPTGGPRWQIANSRFFSNDWKLTDKGAPFVTRIYWGDPNAFPAAVLLRKHQMQVSTR